MYCSKCGAKINDEAVICPKCGCQTHNQLKDMKTENIDDEISAGFIILSIILPIVGLILGIVNLCKKKTKSGTAYLITGIIAWVIFALLFSVL